ncbi:MAG: M15 family metallopeptidase [Clostridiales bacterium]|nr:M15 family metallopeptidase [Clostridiales bacterium]
MRPTNRRIIIALVLFFLLVTTIYSSHIDYSKASDKKHDYEYYYNDTENGGSAVSDYSTTDNSDTRKKPVLPAKIDTNPDSITVLVNKSYPLSQDYVPKDLTVPDIPFHEPGFEEKKQLRKAASDAIEELFDAAGKEGLSLCGVSGYRSYTRQNEIYTSNLRTKGSAYTEQYSAKPGYSEHQTGLAMDISTSSIHYSLDERFFDTPEGEWVSKNAHLYGFIIRYPKDKSSATEYAYEPWHIRYVGVELATLLYENNLTLDEYYGYTPDPSKTDESPNTLDVDSDDMDSMPDSQPSIPETVEPSSDPSPDTSKKKEENKKTEDKNKADKKEESSQKENAKPVATTPPKQEESEADIGSQPITGQDPVETPKPDTSDSGSSTDPEQIDSSASGNDEEAE